MNLNSAQVLAFLETLGKQYPESVDLILLGGSALCLLGSQRPTIDIDYVGDDLKRGELTQAIDKIAKELRLEVDAVPIERFIPALPGAQERSVFYKTFGKINVFILDPYSIALSKVDRGFKTDFEDIVFLINLNLIDIDELEKITREALTHAREFDMISAEVIAHLQELRKRLA